MTVGGINLARTQRDPCRPTGLDPKDREETPMAAKVEHFRVSCGDQTLITFESGKALLIDCNIRASADDPDDDTPDVAQQLKDRLPRDSEDRPYVDAMMLSH